MFGTPDKSFEARCLALRHDSHQLELERQGFVLRLGQQLHGQKPHVHGHLRGLEDVRAAGPSTDAGE